MIVLYYLHKYRCSGCFAEEAVTLVPRDFLVISCLRGRGKRRAVAATKNARVAVPPATTHNICVGKPGFRSRMHTRVTARRIETTQGFVSGTGYSMSPSQRVKRVGSSSGIQHTTRGSGVGGEYEAECLDTARAESYIGRSLVNIPVSAPSARRATSRLLTILSFLLRFLSNRNETKTNPDRTKDEEPEKNSLKKRCNQACLAFGPLNRPLGVYFSLAQRRTLADISLPHPRSSTPR